MWIRVVVDVCRASYVVGGVALLRGAQALAEQSPCAAYALACAGIGLALVVGGGDDEVPL